MKRFLCLLTLALLGGSLSATELNASATTITPGQPNEPAGVLILTVDENDFPGASARSPVYIRFCLPEGVRLAQTLVGPLDNPINLGGRVEAVGSAIESNLLLEAVQLVRFVAGERCFYLKVNQTTETWLRVSGAGLILAPQLDAAVSFAIGFTAANGTLYGFENTDSITAVPVDTLIALDVSRFWALEDVCPIMTVYAHGTNLDPTTAPFFWPKPVLLPTDLLPVGIDDCPAIARTRWFGGLPYPFKN